MFFSHEILRSEDCLILQKNIVETINVLCLGVKKKQNVGLFKTPLLKASVLI